MKRQNLIPVAVLFVVIVIVVLVLVVNCRNQNQPVTRSSLARAPMGYIPRIGKLERPLVDYIATAPSGALLSVVVVLTNQLSETAKRHLFQGITETNRYLRMGQERQVLIQALQAIATNGQKPLLTFIHPLQRNGVVQGVRPLWLSSVIGMQAPTNVIYALASSNEVDYIHLDLPRRIILGDRQNRTSGMSVTAGIKQIEADQVRVPNNQTVVVAVLDTGTDVTHPDLAGNIWTNGNEFGWNFADTNNDIRDVNGHGTFVAGIVAGQGSGQTLTGVEPHAQIMVLRHSNIANRTDEIGCWDAMEYVINHLRNQAGVLNFSAGFTDADSPDYISWRRNVQNLTDANVLFVAAAGDSGSPSFDPLWPFEVLVPARVPAALAVGGVNEREAVALGSSLGPVTWTNVAGFNDYPYMPGPGLIKPDLVAPGSSDTSLNPMSRGGGYINGGGTSYAAPYVSGAAALLLANNPSLNPHELRFILEESAFHAAHVRRFPDSALGWGRVDVKFAFQFAFQTGWDSQTPFDLTILNGGVANTNDLWNLNPSIVNASVTNLGGQIVGNTEMRFYFLDAANGALSDFDPKHDGNPNDSNFAYIGSYFVPVIGPANSKHSSFQGCVLWQPPKQANNGWCFGVWVQAGHNASEINTNNNMIVFNVPMSLSSAR
jgi:subtilisin family serine protease